MRNLDPSICALCGADHPANSDYEFRKKLPFCEKCGPKVEKWPYPRWLKLSLAGLVLLLIASLVYGRKYFHAGREMYLGERLVQERKYAEAEHHLKEAVRIAPNSDKAVLLLAKAALKIGDAETAGKALDGHNEGHFENGQDADFQEVNALWERALGAIEKANKAGELAHQDGKEVEAAKLMHEAAAQYPEAKDLVRAARETDAGVAFSKKDYDRFLSFEQQDYAELPNASSAGGLASAWACKYAVTGNPEFKQQAELFLQKAQELSKSDPEQAKEIEEYLPRIRYRIDSRQIITKQEYDKKFRDAKGVK